MVIFIGILGSIVGFVLLVMLLLEAQYWQRPTNPLDLNLGEWELAVYEPQRYVLVGQLELHNLTTRLEVMAPDVHAEVQLLSSSSLEGINIKTRITPRFEGASVREDGYWEGHVVKSKARDALEAVIEIDGADLSALEVAWVQVHYVAYGSQGWIPKIRHVIVPLKFPSAEASKRWRPTANADVLPIKTHLLTHLDDPVNVVKRYVMPHARPGDIVTLGESPVAIMQGRFHHPSEMKTGWLAKRLCYMFHPTSSLASACGMQTLINIEGSIRVLGAFIIGSIAKLFGIKGMFYRLAGEQARLIDDVTGTIPPYDQFIVLGPDQPQAIVDRIQQETGLSAAIVDVNDLKAVKILAASSNVSKNLLKQALLDNPAGNANEQTPVVLIRPVDAATKRSAVGLQSVNQP